MAMITGRSLYFAGVADKVAIPAILAGLPTGDADRTIELWFKPDKVGIQSLLSWGVYANNKLSEIMLYTDNRIWFAGHTNNADSVDLIPTNGAWNHLVITVEGIAVVFYLNNVSRSKTLSGAINLNTTADTDLHIGARINNSTWAKGWIDEVRIFDRILGATEVAYNYNGGDGIAMPYSTTGLVLWMHLDEGGGLVAGDKSGNDSHGAITGAVWAAGKVKGLGGVWDFATYA